ncbi:MAG: tRNA uridine-5-carboxymethylaminomethyl(34) synthesis GTPase MnmE [Candidatus Pelagibacter sp.]
MTIFALSSAPGQSGVAVFRISGPETGNIIKLITNRDLPSPRKAKLLKINNINNSSLIDEGIILWFPAPNSYTGEDMAELHVHGSRGVITEIQNNLLSTKKCRMAEAGEFTKLAFVNGKINLLKAEAIGDLIAAETQIQIDQAQSIIKGKSFLKFENIRKKIIKILGTMEAKIDFPEEDIPENVTENIKNEVENIEIEIKKILDDNKVGEKIRTGFKIAIIGPPNSGKSSLMNYFSKRDVSIVSEIAGTTRDVLETHLNFDGFPVIISDTAGIRASKDIIEKEGIKLAFKKAEEADLRIVIIEPKNVEFFGFLNDLFDKSSILLINKTDLYDYNVPEQLKKYNPFSISVLKETNIDKLISEIKFILKKSLYTNTDVFITRERHRIDLNNCILFLQDFKNKNLNEEFDKATEDLRGAVTNLGKVVGKVDVEEILSSIFNDFCIGK